MQATFIYFLEMVIVSIAVEQYYVLKPVFT